MCGRYYVDDETVNEINRILKKISDREQAGRGEIYPGSKAPVIKKEEDNLALSVMDWGFPKYKGSGVVFNARSETVLEKNMFRKSLLERRAVIPAKHLEK